MKTNKEKATEILLLLLMKNAVLSLMNVGPLPGKLSSCMGLSCFSFIRSKACLIKPVCCLYACLFMHTSSPRRVFCGFSDLSEIWFVVKSSTCSSMLYDPVQGQCLETFRLRHSLIFKVYLLHHLQLELTNG